MRPNPEEIEEIAAAIEKLLGIELAPWQRRMVETAWDNPRPCVFCQMSADSLSMLSDARCCSGCRKDCPCALPKGEYKAWRDLVREARKA